MDRESRDRRWAEQYRNGSSLSAIARESNVCLQTVRHALLKQGVKMRRRGNDFRKLSSDLRKEILRRYVDEKESQERIGKAVGVSQSVISRFLRSQGIDTGARSKRANWKGGKVIINGYRAVRLSDDSPFVSMRHNIGYVMEHRLIMAKKMGRPLRSNEHVHHINGDKLDNRIENLQLRQAHHGNGVVMQCADCGSHNIITLPLQEEF